MVYKKMIAQSFCFLVIAATLVLSGCAKPPEPMREAPPLPQAPPAPPSEPQKTTEVAPPKLAEAQAAIARIYHDAVSVDESRNPCFVDGDFNGDGSQDLAVVVKPAKDKLADINSDVAGWLLRDAQSETTLQLVLMKRNPHEGKTRPVVTQQDETLLAVVHGYGPQGWRDPEAQQTFLVKNAVGAGLRAQAKKSVREASMNKVLPPLLGDILNQTLAGQAGFIYYTGSSYAWFNPKTYRGEGPKRTAH